MVLETTKRSWCRLCRSCVCSSFWAMHVRMILLFPPKFNVNVLPSSPITSSIDNVIINSAVFSEAFLVNLVLLTLFTHRLVGRELWLLHFYLLCCSDCSGINTMCEYCSPGFFDLISTIIVAVVFSESCSS